MRPEPWAINQALHFRQLIETFVEEAWVSRLDFARAERLDKSFVSEHYKESEADIIYRGLTPSPTRLWVEDGTEEGAASLTQSH